MTKKTTDIISYITIVGWLIAFFCGTKQESIFHLNQSIVLILANLIWNVICKVLIFIPFLGWFAMLAGNLVLIIFWVIGICSAINGTEKQIPIIGSIKIFE